MNGREDEAEVGVESNQSHQLSNRVNLFDWSGNGDRLFT
jgi:hypothetical protein